MSSTNVKKVRKIRTVEDQKRKKKTIIIVISAILALILAAGIILGCINTKAYSVFDEYSFVTITSASSDKITVMNEKTDNSETHDQYYANSLFQSGIKKTRYSILRGIFEGVWANSFKFVTEEVEYTNDKDKVKTRDEKVEIERSEIANIVTAAENAYILEFHYEDVKTIEVKGEQVSFDRAKVLLSVDPNNIIESYTFYLYEFNKTFGIEFEYYTITPVIIKAKATTLHNNITDIIEYFNA